MTRETDDSRTVLFVVADADTPVVDHVARELAVRVRTEAGFEAARTRLAAGGVDCLVVQIDALAGDAAGFLDDVDTIAPSCPVVVLTDGETTASADVLDRATTLVETPTDPDSLAFLGEKIRSALGDGPAEQDELGLYRTLVETARDGLYRLDANGDVAYANESFASMLGYDRSEILGTHGSTAMAEDELERGQRVIQRVLDDDERESEILDMEMVRKDGERVIVAVHFVVLTTDDGAYDGVVGVVRDVTDRRERERELRRKNERLEAFASTVSHDLRNPLNVANGHLALARESFESENLAEVADALDRMDALVEDLLALARAGERVNETEPVALGPLVDACWSTVATGDATLANETTGTLHADPSRLRQLLENLLRNAIEHASPCSQAEPGNAVEHGEIDENDRDGVHVTVGALDDGHGFYVADDGPGIPPEDRDTVFESGVTSNDGGTGFGLAIVQDIVDAHGWTVDVVESDAGGARFELRVPDAD
ncbi:ATP-binding protein [Halorubellus sp. PRR65]|uniref:hybrid sensor histidine kinase/response regulator n=1 Tax=Halorubellus sp. PRR65 TaxID=3098148 RepID=UPI002B25D9CA|nr:ATP-binding protein [Halorubellus sp. PRR65]